MADSKSGSEAKPKTGKSSKPKSPRSTWEKEARLLNRLMLENGGRIASRVKARAVFIFADACRDPAPLEKLHKKINVVLFTKNEKSLPEEVRKYTKSILKIPNIELTRMGHVKVAAVMAINANMLDQGDKAVFVSGISELGAEPGVPVIHQNVDPGHMGVSCHYHGVRNQPGTGPLMLPVVAGEF